jgi:hypothetical protein
MQQYFAVIDAACEQLYNRFSESSIGRLELIETILFDAANGRVFHSPYITFSSYTRSSVVSVQKCYRLPEIASTVTDVTISH